MTVQTRVSTEAAMVTATPEAVPRNGARVAVLVPVVVGLLLGPVDLVLQLVLPSPFSSLANSPALWALVAFAIGWFVPGRHRWWPAVAGTAMLTIAVETYYVAAVVGLEDDPSTLVARAALTWLAFAVAGGVVFGTAGAWARDARPWQGPLGTAVPIGVLLAEAWMNLAQFAKTSEGVLDATYRTELVQTALCLLVLAGLAAIAAGRSARQRVAALVLALPMALAGALLFGAFGLFL